MTPRGVKANRAQSYARLERFAWHVRTEVFGTPPEQALPAAALFENLHRISVVVDDAAVPLDYAVKALPTGMEGLTLFDYVTGRITVVLDEPSYLRLQRDHPRTRFTLCHEISHAVLHADYLVEHAALPFGHGSTPLVGTHKLMFDTEWQANAMAAALLVPATALHSLDVLDRLTVDEVASRFLVSAECAKIRLDVFRRKRSQLLQAGGAAE